MEALTKTRFVLGRGRFPDDVLITARAGARVRMFRQGAGLTQLDLAGQLDISCRTLEKIEAGDTFIRADVAARIAPLFARIP